MGRAKAPKRGRHDTEEGNDSVDLEDVDIEMGAKNRIAAMARGAKEKMQLLKDKVSSSRFGGISSNIPLKRNR